MKNLAPSSEYKHRLLTSKAKVQNSKTHGIGVVATEPISKGEIVCIFGGVVIHSSCLPEYRKKIGHLGFQVDDDFFLCASVKEEKFDTGSFNHSCSPNIGFAGSIKLIAIRDIQAGEELVFDYASANPHSNLSNAIVAILGAER